MGEENSKRKLLLMIDITVLNCSFKTKFKQSAINTNCIKIDVIVECITSNTHSRYKHSMDKSTFETRFNEQKKDYLLLKV